MVKRKKRETVQVSFRIPVELRDLLVLVADEIPGMSVNALVVSMLESNEARIRELLTISRKLKAAPDPVAAFERVEALVEDARRDAVGWEKLTDASDTAVEEQTSKAHG